MASNQDLRTPKTCLSCSRVLNESSGFLPPQLLWQTGFFLFFIYDPLHLVQKKDFFSGVPEERKPPTHFHKHMLASWGTFLKRWICLLGTADSLSYFPFLSSFLFSSFPLSFSFVFLQIEFKENKTVLNFYFSPVTKSFRMLSSQSLLLCTLTAQKETAIPIHFESTDFFFFFFFNTISFLLLPSCNIAETSLFHLVLPSGRLLPWQSGLWRFVTT